MPNKDAQFLETRQFGRTEICGIFRVPPHMVGDLSRSTFSNMEQESANLVQYSLTPLVRRVESVINSTLLAGTPFYLEYLIDSLVRGDIRTRMDSYSRAIQSGIMSPDEARAKENLEPDPSGAGAKLFMMANVVPIESAGKVVAPPADLEPEEDEQPEPVKKPEEEIPETEDEGEKDGV
jgi:phage portal protein BeeE